MAFLNRIDARPLRGSTIVTIVVGSGLLIFSSIVMHVDGALKGDPESDSEKGDQKSSQTNLLSCIQWPIASSAQRPTPNFDFTVISLLGMRINCLKK